MIWHALKSNIRQLGWGTGILYSVDRAMQQLSGGRFRIVRYRLVAQPVAEPIVKALRPSVSTSIRKIDNCDPIVSHFPREATVIQRRFDVGAECYVAEVNHEFAGYLWLAFGGFAEDEVRCDYHFAQPIECVWDFDVYVEPTYRLGRTFVRLWDAVNRDLTARGVSWSCSRISAFNPESVAAHRRLGIVELYTATFFCLGTLQILAVGRFPYLHVGWRNDSRATLYLDPPQAGRFSS